MKRFLLTIFLFLTPVTALALDYTDRSTEYADAPFLRAEAVAITVLTNLGIVQGNPDGTFAAERTLTRAEFLALALRALPDVATLDASSCFPDVQANAWFAGYVCGAKNAGFVQGYIDGLFHPERPVLYAEAVKILDGTFNFSVPAASPGEAWYEPFMQVSSSLDLTLPMDVNPTTPLLRGQMARLLARFIADSEGSLQEYDAAEQGQLPSISSSSGISVSSVPAPAVLPLHAVDTSEATKLELEQILNTQKDLFRSAVEGVPASTILAGTCSVKEFWEIFRESKYNQISNTECASCSPAGIHVWFSCSGYTPAGIGCFFDVRPDKSADAILCPYGV